MLTQIRPSSQANVLLFLYDFTMANKLVRLEMVSKFASTRESNVVPLAAFTSLSSYLLQHAHRSPRVSAYACLNLLTLQVLISDFDVTRQICSPDNATPVRLCRQKAPLLPAVKNDRILAGAILDAVTGGISHNLRRRLDVELYK